MVRSTLGQSLDSALMAWRNLVSNGPSGPGINFSETNRTRLCRARLDSFLENPSTESFNQLWSREALASYWAPAAAELLSPDNAVESLHAVFLEMRSAEEFDPTWTGRLAETRSEWGIHELFWRLQGGTEPIPSIEAKNILSDIGYDTENNPESVSTGIKNFRARYNSCVGRASEGTSYEIPVYAEIDEFFRLVATADRELINSQVTGPYAPLFRPLIGKYLHTDTTDPFRWSGVNQLIKNHVDARDSGAYDDLETAHWGGTHIESWKWQFKNYFQNIIRSGFDLTELTAEDVPQLFEAIQKPDEEFDAVSNVPAKMMGGRFHRLTWGNIVDYCIETPNEAATILSDLYDEKLPVVDRLNEFYEFFHHLTTREENSRSPGSILRAATALLMYAYPQRHITFQYQRMDHFFEKYSTSEGLDTGFKAGQYREVAIACRDLLKKIKDQAGDASMIDVQTLVYIADDA